MIKEIKVHTLTRDCGDGSNNISIFNTIEDLLDDCASRSSEPFTEEKKQEILDEYDPYENGYLSTTTIHIKIDEDGNVSLAKPIWFNSG